MGYTAFLASEVPTDGAGSRAREADRAGSPTLAVSKTELEFAIAALERRGGGLAGDGGPRAGLPPVVDALMRFQGAIAHPEVAEGRGRRFETGRTLTGLAAMRAVAKGFDAYGENRAIRFDAGAVAATLRGGKSPVRAFEDRLAWERAGEVTASRGNGMRRAVSRRAEPVRRLGRGIGD